MNAVRRLLDTWRKEASRLERMWYSEPQREQLLKCADELEASLLAAPAVPPPVTPRDLQVRGINAGSNDGRPTEASEPHQSGDEADGAAVSKMSAAGQFPARRDRSGNGAERDGVSLLQSGMVIAAPAVPQEEQEHTCRQIHSDGTKTTSSELARKDDRAAATRRSKTPENARTAAATSGAAQPVSAPGLLKSATDAAPAVPAQEETPKPQAIDDQSA